jgi:tetrahydromethanopterin S-methyltransferase subunit D
MKTHEREHHASMVVLTAGIGGMVLGFGVYRWTHFAPAILCGVVLSVLFTLIVTREGRR